jgi:hypothetical protein
MQVFLKPFDACHVKVKSKHEYVNLFNSYSYNVKLQNVSLTLAFEVGMCFFNATHSLDVVDIYAKLFQ